MFLITHLKIYVQCKWIWLDWCILFFRNLQDWRQNSNPNKPSVSFLGRVCYVCSPWRAEWWCPWRPVPVTSKHLLPTAVRATASWWRRKGTLCPDVSHLSLGLRQKPKQDELGMPVPVILHKIHVKRFWPQSGALQISIWDKWTWAH